MEVIYSLKTIGKTNLVFTYFPFNNPAFHLGISETTLIASSSKYFFSLPFQLHVFNTTRFIDNKFDKNSSCFFVSYSFFRINHTFLDIACRSLHTPHELWKYIDLFIYRVVIYNNYVAKRLRIGKI